MSKSHLRIISQDGKKMGYSDCFWFDLDKKTISNGDFIVMHDGELLCNEIKLSNGTKFEFTDLMCLDYCGDFYEEVEERFLNYKYSVPTKHEQSVKKRNFKALVPDDLTFKQLSSNEKRATARVKLDAYILFCSIIGKSHWNNDNHFFYASEKQKDLILFRSWVKQKKEV